MEHVSRYIHGRPGLATDETDARLQWRRRKKCRMALEHISREPVEIISLTEATVAEDQCRHNRNRVVGSCWHAGGQKRRVIRPFVVTFEEAMSMYVVVGLARRTLQLDNTG